MPKFSRDGPAYINANVRLTRRQRFGTATLDVMVEVFNLFNRVNLDPNSVINGMYLSGPTLANPALPYVPDSRYGQFTSTLPPFEAQLGLRAGF